MIPLIFTRLAINWNPCIDFVSLQHLSCDYFETILGAHSASNQTAIRRSYSEGESGWNVKVTTDIHPGSSNCETSHPRPTNAAMYFYCRQNRSSNTVIEKDTAMFHSEPVKTIYISLRSVLMFNTLSQLSKRLFHSSLSVSPDFNPWTPGYDLDTSSFCRLLKHYSNYETWNYDTSLISIGSVAPSLLCESILLDMPWKPVS